MHLYSTHSNLSLIVVSLIVICYLGIKKIMAFEKLMALTADLLWLDFAVFAYVHKPDCIARIKQDS